MSELYNRVMAEGAKAFTHGGKFHADDVFTSALLLHLNPEIQIARGNKVPEDFDGIVFDIGRGQYDHHQRDSRIRENGVPFAAFGLVWEELGTQVLSEELAVRFDEEFIQPLDINDNTGEKNELASMIGDFNPGWDGHGNTDEAFFRAVSFATMVLLNKFEKYRGNERADLKIAEYLDAGVQEKILVMPEFVPFQKKLSETDVEFVIYPSNRGGFCVQPLKKAGSMNYKCSFPENWAGLENEDLQKETGLESATFCHKSGFLLSVGSQEDAVKACQISREQFTDSQIIIWMTEEQEKEDGALLVPVCDGAKEEFEAQLKQTEKYRNAVVQEMEFPKMPALTCSAVGNEIETEKEDWKQLQKDTAKKILAQKPEMVVLSGNMLMAYPLIHSLRKKKIPVLVPVKEGAKIAYVRIPSGS